MIDVASELSVQSFCFRNFDNARTAEMVREIGANGIELCGVHVKWSDPDSFDQVIQTYADAGVKIVSVGVNGMGDDEPAERNCFEFAKQAGCKHMSIDFAIGKVPAAYRTAEKLADEYDIQLGIHNHGGRHWLGCAQILEHVFSQTGERIGLAMDTAWAMHSHEDPIAWVRRFGSRLTNVHLKDFIFDRDGSHKDVIVGSGNLDLSALKAALMEIDYQGLAVIEYEADPDNPVPALTECVKSIRDGLSG